MPPYVNPFMQYSMPQHTEIIKVNGKNGAEAYNMMPNSSILLLDETEPIVWLAQTDGAGYKTLKPYTITPYQPEPQVDVKTLEQRIARIEVMLNESNDVSNESAKGKTTN